MSGVIMMAYVLPMMLGRTYDNLKDAPGIQIFNETAVENSEVIQNYYTDSRYRMVDDSNDVRDLLDIRGKLALKVKAGMVDIEGEGNYLKDRATRDNSIEILIKVDFESITRSISTSWTPNKDWTLQNEEFLGTHYCRSITYGGELIASVRFLARNHFDKEKIKGAIQAGTNAKAFELGLGAKLEKLQEELHDTTSMEIRYYATVPIPGVANSIAGLMSLVDNFPNHVKQYNNGIGNPLRMELYPLSALDKGKMTYIETTALNDQFEDMEDQFDDLLTARKEISLWIASLPPALPATVKKQISKFSDEVEQLMGVYSKSIAELGLNLLQNASAHFEAVFKAYEGNGGLISKKYVRKFRELQNQIYKEEPELQPVYGGATFVHWGKPKCDKLETIISGVAITSDVNEDGGSSSIICSSAEPDFQGSSKMAENSSGMIFNSPVVYRGRTDAFQHAIDKHMSCAKCRSSRHTNVVVFHGFTTCPTGWSVLYTGIFMAPDDSSVKREYICVDSSLETISGVRFGNSNQEKKVGVKEVSVKCGILPCDVFKSNVALRCAVCARN